MKNKENDLFKFESINMHINIRGSQITDMKNKENDFKGDDVAKMKSIVETILYTDTSVTLPGICTRL